MKSNPMVTHTHTYVYNHLDYFLQINKMYLLFTRRMDMTPVHSTTNYGSGWMITSCANNSNCLFKFLYLLNIILLAYQSYHWLMTTFMTIDRVTIIKNSHEVMIAKGKFGNQAYLVTHSTTDN